MAALLFFTRRNFSAPPLVVRLPTSFATVPVLVLMVLVVLMVVMVVVGCVCGSRGGLVSVSAVRQR